MANITSLLFHSLSDVSWVGFYLVRNEQLVLGPFMGKPVCVWIPKGSGVCGTAYSAGVTQRVDDVDAFSGHIACDVDSWSEIVIPVMSAGKVVAVLDIDSPMKARFNQQDEEVLKALVQWFEQQLDVNQLMY